MTIIDVAKRAGVSKATVSRVINEQGNVSPKAMQAVLKAMKETHYLPPFPRPGRRSAGETPSGKQQNLSIFALLLPKMKGALFPSVQHGFEEAARERYHQIVVCNSDNDIYRQANTIVQLLQKRVAGIAIVTPTVAPTPPDQIRVLQNAGIPVVLLHRPVEEVHAPVIKLPFEQIGQAVGHAFLERGHRRVAFFSRIRSPSSQLVEAGLRRTLKKAGADLPEELVYYGNAFNITMVPDEEAGMVEAMERILALPAQRRPTAIYSNDALAEFIYLNLLRMGIQIGKDLSLLGFGSQWREGAIGTKLTSITVDEIDVGRRAIELLGEMCDGNRSLENDETIIMPLNFYEGETLKPATE